jgi:hypothetical protein
MLFNIHDIFSFEIAGTNKRILKSICNNFRTFQTNENVEADLNIFVTDFKPDLQDCYLIDQKYFVKKDYIFCVDSYKGARWKLAIENIAGRPTVFFNGNTFSSYFLQEYVVEPLIALKMVDKGFSALHAAGITFNQNAFVFPACKGVGKTNTLIYSAERGASYLSNEKCIIADDGSAYGFPTDIDLYYYNAKNEYLSQRLSFRNRANLLINYLIYRLSFRYASFPVHVNPTKLFAEIENKAPLSSLILLTKTKNDSIKVKEHVDKKELISRLVLVNVFEMPYLLNLLQRYSYIFPEVNLALTYTDGLEDNLTKALEKISCFEVEIPRKYDSQVYLNICKLITKDFDNIMC